MERNNFTIPITLPVSGKAIRLNEINNRSFLSICKFTQNNDFTGLINCLKTHIQEFDNIDNVVDKIYALISLRIFFIGDEIQITNRERAAVTISLTSVLSELERFEFKENYKLEINNFIIKFKPVRFLPGEDLDIYDCIQSISLFDTEIQDNIEKILDRVPPNVYSAINQRVLDLHNAYKDVTIICGNEKIKLEPLIINLLSDQLVYFINSIFKNDLNTILETIYVFAQHFKNIDFFELSPLDSRVLENILHRELKEAQKSNEPNHANPLTPNL